MLLERGDLRLELGFRQGSACGGAGASARGKLRVRIPELSSELRVGRRAALLRSRGVTGKRARDSGLIAWRAIEGAGVIRAHEAQMGMLISGIPPAAFISDFAVCACRGVAQRVGVRSRAINKSRAEAATEPAMIARLRRTASTYTLSALLLGIGLTAFACSSDGTGDGPPGDSNEAGSPDGKPDGGADSEDGGTSSGGRSGSGTAGSAASGGGRANRGGSSSSGGTTTNGGGATTGGYAGGVTTDAACNNGVDDDGDGLLDGFDPECTGPFDNAEDSFATGIPGDNRDPKWQDCFFDGNSGAGDDGCRYNTGCLTGDLEADDPSCTLTEQCVTFCKPLTQNGCDCFGCCTIQREDGTSVDILENAMCSLAQIDDEGACPRCIKTAQCENTCGECELCPGKTELPESCYTDPPTDGGAGGASSSGGSSSAGRSSGGASPIGGTGSSGSPSTPPPTHTCDSGEPVCGPGLPPCEPYEYCSFGCCIVTVR